MNFGNIFQKIATLEEVNKAQEVQFKVDLSGPNKETLHKAQAKWKKQLQWKKKFWKHKAGIEWFQDGERNTKFFQTIVNWRRRRLRVNMIQNDEGVWLKQQEDCRGNNRFQHKAIHKLTVKILIL